MIPVSAHISEALPEITTVLCTCEDGWAPTTAGDDYETYAPCGNPHCYKGWIEVCSGCLETPTADSDTCGCNRPNPEVLWALSVGMITKEQVGL